MKNSTYNWKKKDQEVFENIVRYMKLNLSRALTLSDLARHGAINEDKLKKGFRYFFGCTVHQHLLHLRMKRAYELVLETDKPFKEIASLVGYRPRNFFHSFKKLFGRTPGQLRITATLNSHN